MINPFFGRLTVDPHIQALIDLAKEKEETQNNCYHSFRKIISNITVTRFSWQCTECGQMQPDTFNPPLDQISPLTPIRSNIFGRIL